MTDRNQNSEPQNDADEPMLPRLLFETITFSDETKITLGDDDIVVFVGPNNAGKSAALRELGHWVSKSKPGLVVKKAELRRESTSRTLREYLEANAQKHGDIENICYGGIGYDISESHLGWFEQPTDRHPVAPFFAKRLTTESRITDSNAANAIALHQKPPTHPIHLLLMDEGLAADMSAKFNRAFGMDMVPFRAGGGQWPLYVGRKPAVPPGKDELSKEFVEALQESCDLLETQGDGMRSFAAVMLHLLAPRGHSIQFLDEPEAFLHPPQAKLLGNYIAENKAGNAQLFIATHSTSVLEGLIEGSSDRVRIVRLRREGNVNPIRELDKDRTKAVANDSLTRFSRVFEGIFCEHVFICEADADCMFYQSILEIPAISGDRRPDVLFVHAAGKQRMARLAETLRSLDVPISVIADIDILNDEGIFKNLFETLGGNWEDVKTHWKTVRDAVVNLRPDRNADEVKEMILEEIKDIAGTGVFPKDKERAIKRVLKELSPWKTIKRSGRSALPNGQPTKQFDQLLEKCRDHGLWIVPVGELESFCQTIELHGPGFVAEVLENPKIETDHELEEAREFMRKIWEQAMPAS